MSDPLILAKLINIQETVYLGRGPKVWESVCTGCKSHGCQLSGRKRKTFSPSPEVLAKPLCIKIAYLCILPDPGDLKAVNLYA